MPPLLGCIADDVTGASDLASALTVGGMRTQLWFGHGYATATEDAVDAIVIALKTRSLPKEDAIAQSLQAFRTLQECGVTRFLFKYCSTFDSTNVGNIGPVAEALMQALSTPVTIFCPTTPENGRTVYCGHLFVKGRLLNRSGMENHPLNPMTESDLTQVLQHQSRQTVSLISHEIVRQGPAAIASAMGKCTAQQTPLVVVDALDDHDLQAIAAAVVDMPLVTSGSGLGSQLPKAYWNAGRLFSLQNISPPPQNPGNALVLAGSCSVATRKQVEAWPSDWPALLLDVEAVIRGDLTLAEVVRWTRQSLQKGHALVYSSSPPENVASLQRQFGIERTAAVIEELVGGLARAMVADGVQKLVVAGGETSGAVVQALGCKRFRIGPPIAPGIPWMETLDQPHLAIALKSGNFGDEHFFRSALEMLP